jgi:hypothetical protein
VVLEGRVVGLRDEGIEGASVAVFDAGTWRPEGAATLEALVRTGEVRRPFPLKTAVAGPGGEFRMELAPLPCATVEAGAEGWRKSGLPDLDLFEDRRDVVLRLRPTATVSGTVHEALPRGLAGLPLEGVRLHLLGEPERGGPGGSGEERTVFAEAVSDAEGRFALEGAPVGQYAVLAAGPGRTPVLVDRIAAPAEDLRVLLPEAIPGTLRGAVLLPDAATPAAGVEVRAETRPRGRIVPCAALATTDREGRFRIGDLEIEPGGKGTPLFVEVRVEGKGYVRLETKDWTGDSDERLVLRAWPTGVLQGRVTAEPPGASPFPVPGLEVRTVGGWRPDPEWPELVLEGRCLTRKDGSWSIAGVPEGTRQFPLKVHPDVSKTPYSIPETYDPAPSPPPARGPWTFDIELLAPPPPGPPAPGTAEAGREGKGAAPEPAPEPEPWLVVIRGVVAGPEGEAVRGAIVRGWGKAGILTDRAGTFEVRDTIPPERAKATLNAWAPGYVRATFGPFDVVAPGEIRGIEIPLKYAVLPVLGRVVDAEGKPVAGAVVGWDRPGSRGSVPDRLQWSPDRTVTRPDGTYRFEASRRAEFAVVARKPGVGEGILDPVTAGEAVPDLVLLPPRAGGRR